MGAQTDAVKASEGRELAYHTEEVALVRRPCGGDSSKREPDEEGRQRAQPREGLVVGRALANSRN